MNKVKITNDIWIELQGQFLQQLLHSYPTNNKLNKVFASTDLLYHYTSLDAFVSIVKSQSLYFTNVNFLNDSKEFLHGVYSIKMAVEELREKENNEILDKIESNTNQLLEKEKYVACFSKEGDLLSQWKAYANNGKGVSIGFEFDNLRESFDQFLTGSHIEYDESIQLESLKEYITLGIKFFSPLEEKFDWQKQNFNNLTAKFIVGFLNNVIHSFKHPAFRDEREYRLQLEIDDSISEDDDIEVLFRSTEKLVVPYTIVKNSYSAYVENKNKNEIDPIFPIKKLPLAKIIVGPSLEFETVKNGIDKFLISQGYKDIEIIKSHIPYRH